MVRLRGGALWRLTGYGYPISEGRMAMNDIRDAAQRLEELIRADQQKRNARTLLEALQNAGRAAQPGLWLAATILDPSIKDEY